MIVLKIIIQNMIETHLASIGIGLNKQIELNNHTNHSIFKHMKKISPIVLNYNNAKDTIECVSSLLLSNTTPHSIIIIDNKSTDASCAEITEWLVTISHPVDIEEQKTPWLPTSGSQVWAFTHPLNIRILLVAAKSNKGYAAGNNIGLSICFKEGADAAWILNNDTIVAPDALRAMSDKLFSQPHYGLCGSCVLYYHIKDRVQCRSGGKTNYWTGLSRLNGNGQTIQTAHEALEQEVEDSINFIYGASVMLTQSFYETVGEMDEDFFLYCEEQDWACRNKKRFGLAYASNAIVFHKEGATTGWPGSKGNLRSLWLITRSRVLLFRKHAPWSLPVLFCGIAYAGIRLLARRFFSVVIH
ncbi:glycosyltransferase family 2 protein [Desulfovibrio cuneatus]|uniref:glycosyltransferase family 2 protein n=1 Tax=Desulfovibrio cuneatus TaxID=159728 RepID=UPI000416A95B|nr:glycosyltransferase family 2 protein [Desulfovibrio cuneatus]